MEIKGKYTNAQVYTNDIDSKSISQIIELCNQEIFKNNKVRIMPDVHAGKGCVIGFTSTFKDKIIPNIVGVDIGCGMLTVELGNINIDFESLDEFINANIPHGFEVNENEDDFVDMFLDNLKYKKQLKNVSRIKKSLGTLGGGNHFIEINIDEDKNKYLVIHSGSRNLGLQIAKWYQNIAIKNLTSIDNKINETIKKLKSEGRQREISKELSLIKRPKIKKDLAYLEGNDAKDYLNDMSMCVQFASASRVVMARKIIEFLGMNAKMNTKLFFIDNYFETIHNYIDLKNNIIRKGAVSAQKGEKILIPLNMRDGSIIAIGKGNEDWNCSAPHGAGRIMSRSKAKEQLSMEEYVNTMKGIYTTSVCESTIDEAPMTYKNKESIINNITDTVEVVKIIKPIYNFKSK